MSTEKKKELSQKKKALHQKIHYPKKTGINMNMREKRTREALTIAIGSVLIIGIAGLVAKFGVIDQFQRLSNAQSQYENVHRQYTEVETTLENYDKVLAEYRTYSTDWMNSSVDSKSKNLALYEAVDRQQVLDLVEKFMMTEGTVNSISVKDNTMRVDMSGMSLDEISAMFQKISESPIVKDVDLDVAESEQEYSASIVNFTMTITLGKEEEE